MVSAGRGDFQRGVRYSSNVAGTRDDDRSSPSAVHVYFVKKSGTLPFVVDTGHAHERPVDTPVVPRRAQPKRRAARFLVMLVAAVLVGNALIGERGLIAMIRANHDLTSLSRMIAELRVANEELRADARRLRDEPRAIEEVARRQLGLIRPGERVFIVTMVPALGTSATPAP